MTNCYTRGSVTPKKRKVWAAKPLVKMPTSDAREGNINERFRVLPNYFGHLFIADLSALQAAVPWVKTMKAES